MARYSICKSFYVYHSEKLAVSKGKQPKMKIPAGLGFALSHAVNEMKGKYICNSCYCNYPSITIFSVRMRNR